MTRTVRRRSPAQARTTQAKTARSAATQASTTQPAAPSACTLAWPGKAEAFALADVPPPKRDDFVAAERIDATGREGRRGAASRDPHRFYVGENLAVLRQLAGELAGAVKMIYIDPPYNNGNERFVYRDRFDAGHAEWLSFMAPRLILARRLLTDDGMLCLSIDDGELAHVTLLLDEIFGEENRVANFVWSGGRKNDSRLASVSHEYLVCYARCRKTLAAERVRWHERKPGLEPIYAERDRLLALHGADYTQVNAGLKRWYSRLPAGDPSRAHAHYCRCDGVGVYFADNISWPGGGGPTYPVLHPVTGRPCKVPSRGWVFATPERMAQEMAADRVEFGADETKVPTRKRYLHETEHQALASVFYQDGRAASQRLKRMFGKKVFDHPKDERVLARFAGAMTSADDLTLDFFAGSGAWGHAVLLANAVDGGARRFILVQQPEPTGWRDLPTIADVGLERLRRVLAAETPGAAVQVLRPRSSC